MLRNNMLFNLLILYSTLCVAKCEDNIEWFRGKWYAVVQFPKPLFVPFCQTIDFQPTTDADCICGTKGEVPVVNHITTLPGNVSSTHTAPVIVVNTSAEVDDALNVQCKCNDKDKPHEVYRKINENIFIVYDKPFYLSQYKAEPNKAMVMVKTVPKLSQLREALKSIGDLSRREPTYLCEPNFFINEFEDLD